MQVSKVSLLLLIQNVVSAAYFYYDKGCCGNRVLFTFNGDTCIHLDNGYANSMAWDEPGARAIAVAYSKDSAHPFCSKEACHIHGLGEDSCCNSRGNKKNIKGANLVSMGGCPSKRKVEPCLSAWEHGAMLQIDVGHGVYVRVPNKNSTAPSLVDIREALVTAGIERGLDLLITRAVADVSV